MPTTQLPPSKEKAHEIARKIANERPSRRNPAAPEANVSGGFNQKSRLAEDERMRRRKEAGDGAGDKDESP